MWRIFVHFDKTFVDFDKTMKYTWSYYSWLVNLEEYDIVNCRPDKVCSLVYEYNKNI